MRHQGKTHNRCRGFSLVETLVALVVLSTGMLGVALLYLESLKAGRTAVLRTQAITMAGDLADRIRANDTAGVAYAGAGGDNNCVAGGIDCTPVQMAAHDLFLWQQDVANNLPNGAAGIVFTPGVLGIPNRYRITLTWDVVGAPAPVTYQLNVDI